MANLVFVKLLLAGALILMAAAQAEAADPEQMAKDVERDLRNANSSIMTGKHAAALTLLEDVDKRIAQIQKAAPGHPRLANILKNFTTYKDKVEQKLGKKMSLVADYTPPAPPAPAAKAEPAAKAPKPAAATAAAPAAKAEAGPAKLPSNARTSLDKFNKLHSRMMNNPSEEMLNSMGASLEEAINAAEKAGAGEHPDIEDAKAKYAEAEESLKGKSAAAAKEKEAKSAKSGGVKKDVEELNAIARKIKEIAFMKLGSASKHSIHDRDFTRAEAMAATIKGAEKDMAESKRILEAFKKKYGSSQKEVDEKTDGEGNYSDIMAIESGLESIEKAKENTMDSLMEDFEAQAKRLKGEGGELNSKEIQARMKKILSVAETISPESPKLKAAKSSSASLVASAGKERDAAIDSRKWTGHGPNAPADKEALAKAAGEYLSKNPVWQREKGWEKLKTKVKAIAVSGPWNVHKTDAFKNPIQYVIGFDVAMETDDPEDKAQNVIRLVRVFLYTAEAGGVKQSPPFTYGNIAHSQHMRASALK